MDGSPGDVKWRACDVGEAKEGLENDLWSRWSNGRIEEWAATLVKRRKGWRMSCDVSEATESLENELPRIAIYKQPIQSSFFIGAVTSWICLSELWRMGDSPGELSEELVT